MLSFFHNKNEQNDSNSSKKRKTKEEEILEKDLIDKILIEKLEEKEEKDNNYKNDIENIFYEKFEYINIMIIGMTGSGKSLLTNRLLRHDFAKSSSSASNVTSTNELHKSIIIFENKFYVLNILDTIGFSDNNVTDQEILNLVDKTLKESHINRLHRIIFCIKKDRITKQICDRFEYFENKTCDHARNIISTFITHCNDDKNKISDLIANLSSQRFYDQTISDLYFLDLKNEENSRKVINKFLIKVIINLNTSVKISELFIVPWSRSKIMKSKRYIVYPDSNDNDD
jgi:hypothetical protein